MLYCYSVYSFDFLTKTEIMYLWGGIDTYDQILVEHCEDLIEELLSHVEVGVDGIVVLGVPLIFAFE